MATRVSGVGIGEHPKTAERTAFKVLAAISFCHLLNDMVQSLLPALYPILKSSFHLDFGQIGLITMTNQITQLGNDGKPLLGVLAARVYG